MFLDFFVPWFLAGFCSCCSLLLGYTARGLILIYILDRNYYVGEDVCRFRWKEKKSSMLENKWMFGFSPMKPWGGWLRKSPFVRTHQSKGIQYPPILKAVFGYGYCPNTNTLIYQHLQNTIHLFGIFWGWKTGIQQPFFWGLGDPPLLFLFFHFVFSTWALLVPNVSIMTRLDQIWSHYLLDSHSSHIYWLSNFCSLWKVFDKTWL